MRNKILLGIAILLVLLILTVRYFFKNQYTEFEVSIKKYESEQLANFQNEKEKTAKKMANEGLEQFFNQYFDERKYFIEKDTSFSFLYLSGSLRFKSGRFEYFDCLYNKCIVEKINEISLSEIKNKENVLEKKFGSTFTSWYPKLKDKGLVQKINNIEGCLEFYTDLYEISFNEQAWKEFENFMTSYDREIRLVEVQNKKAETEYNQNVASTKNNLKSSVANFFNDKLSYNKSQILTKETERKVFNSTTLGMIAYNITKSKFNKQAFQNVAEDAFEEQWKYNSLRTGSMPYSSCYGSSNYCSDWGCSEIKVITGGSGDVLVSIKNSKGKVVRHAYIKGGNSFTFNVPDGSYQVFFYSGTGWNPNKQMPSSTCNSLKGGFVSNEDVTKDNYINLDSQIMSYELILQQQGNFRTKPSSKNEAF